MDNNQQVNPSQPDSPKGSHPKQDHKQAKDQASPLKAYAVYSSVAIQMIAIIGIGTFAGIKLDEKYGDGGNTWTLVLSLTSVCLAIFFVIRRILAASKDS